MCPQDMKAEATVLKERVLLAAPHHSSMHGLHLQKPAFGLTVRAVTRWLEEHMVSEHLRSGHHYAYRSSLARFACRGTVAFPVFYKHAVPHHCTNMVLEALGDLDCSLVCFKKHFLSARDEGSYWRFES